MRLYNIKTTRIDTRRTTESYDSPDQMSKSYEFGGGEYSHHELRITELKKDLTSLQGVADALRVAHKAMWDISNSVPGTFKVTAPALETEIKAQNTEKYLIEQPIVLINVEDKDVPEFNSIIAVHDGIQGLYTESTSFGGIRVSVDGRKSKIDLFTKDDGEQDPLMCYHLEQWLASQGETLDERYTVEL